MAKKALRWYSVSVKVREKFENGAWNKLPMGYVTVVYAEAADKGAAAEAVLDYIAGDERGDVTRVVQLTN